MKLLQVGESRSYTETGGEALPEVSRESWMSRGTTEHKDCTCVYMLEVARIELEAVLRQAVSQGCCCGRVMWHTVHPRDPQCFALVCACKKKTSIARCRMRLARSTRPFGSCYSHIYYWESDSKQKCSPGVSFVLDQEAMRLLLEALQPAVGDRHAQFALLSVCLAHCSLRMCMRYLDGRGSIVVDVRSYARSSELVKVQ